tara:strand:- start:1023 stop:1409 length:387 start_codon:yes stop_codon:yes gene_type:complete
MIEFAIYAGVGLLATFTIFTIGRIYGERKIGLKWKEDVLDLEQEYTNSLTKWMRDKDVIEKSYIERKALYSDLLSEKEGLEGDKNELIEENEKLVNDISHTIKSGDISRILSTYNEIKKDSKAPKTGT